MGESAVTSMFAEFKQRQIFQVATIYAVAAWPMIQIADLLVPALQLPDSVMTTLLGVFIIGFPISLLLSWMFNITPQGIVLAGDQSEKSESGNVTTNITLTLTIVGVLLITAISVIGIQMYIMDESAPTEIADTSPLVQNNIVQPVNDKPSIAVLPFEVFSKDQQDEFFVDGMVEELLNHLAKIPNLHVAARTSSFAYKGVQNKTVVQIGRELGVNTILEGSIRKNDTSNLIRVTAQLINAKTGEHLWSETFDREYRDIFQIQDEIAKSVVGKMKHTLLGNNDIKFKAETGSVDAMIAFGKGQSELTHRTKDSLEKALEHFNQAISLDPSYARAYVGRADATYLLSLYGGLDSRQAQADANLAIDQALLLDENLGAAYASRGLINSEHDQAFAEQSFKRAIELSPNYAMSYMWYGSMLKASGKNDDALQMFEKALSLDPKSPVAAYNVAWGYFENGNEEGAMSLFSVIVANDPYYPGAYNLVGGILNTRGRLDEAIVMYKRALEVDAINQGAIKGLISTAIDLGDFDFAESWFTYIEQNQVGFSKDVINLTRVNMKLAQGKTEEAGEYLAKIDFSHSPMIDMIFRAEKSYYLGEYGAALKVYRDLKQHYGEHFINARNGYLAIHMAAVFQELEMFEEAQTLLAEISAVYQQKIAQRNNNPSVYYNMAMVKTLQQKENEALLFMQSAIDAGWTSSWQVDIDPIFKNLQKNDQFSLMMGGVKARVATMRTRLASTQSFGNEQDEFFGN